MQGKEGLIVMRGSDRGLWLFGNVMGNVELIKRGRQDRDEGHPAAGHIVLPRAGCPDLGVHGARPVDDAIRIRRLLLDGRRSAR